jgi:hypothetical protein
MSDSPGVSIQPAMMPLQRIFFVAYALATFLVRIARVAFDAEYGTRNDWPQCADCDRMLTMLPGCFFSIR